VADTLVCDSLHEARQLAYHSAGSDRYKVVTIDGSLINKAGLMTGGSSPADRARASKWNQKEHERLKQQAESASRELSQLGSVLSSDEAERELRERLLTAEQESGAAKNEVLLCKERQAKHEKQMATVRIALVEAQREVRESEKKAKSLDKELATLKQQLDVAEDAIFAAFSASLGISSVRDFEERQLRVAQQEAEEAAELSGQRDKLEARLRLEEQKHKEVPASIKKLQAQVSTDAAALELKAASREKVEASVSSLREMASKLEEEVQAVKSERETRTADSKQAKKALRVAAEELDKSKSKLEQLETELVDQRSKRQQTFQQARMAEVQLPVLSPESEDTRQRAPHNPAKRKRSGGGAAELLASESFSPSDLVGTSTLEGEGASSEARDAADAAEPSVRIDFSSVETGTVDADLEKEIAEVSSEMDRMAPNMKALEQYDEVQARLHSLEYAHREMASSAKEVTQRFHAVQQQRHKRYMDAFNKVSRAIDDVYKELTQVEGVLLGGTAYLSLEDPSEPYLHGIKYTAMPPAKRFRDMEQLSGGERTVAALALLFAIHNYRPSPFFVMDEVDAALDNVNVTRVAEYIRDRSQEGGLQFVVISLKDNFYAKAQGLVGIYRDRQEECSKTVTLDLERLDEDSDDADADGDRAAGASGGESEEESEGKHDEEEGDESDEP